MKLFFQDTNIPLLLIGVALLLIAWIAVIANNVTGRKWND